VKACTRREIRVILALSLLAASSYSSSAASEEEPIPQALSLTVYFDGYVLVEYDLGVDPTSPAVNITLFGQVLEDVTVEDHEGFPLDHSFTDGEITVYSLGAEQLTITYSTQDLTKKEGRYWTLETNATTNATIVLPSGASILSLNRVPQIIESGDGQVLLVMPKGPVQVTYVLGVVGTREHAQVVLDDAEKTINEIRGLGVIVTEAEEKLQEAMGAFGSGSYAQAENLGYEARDLALLINQTAAEALTTMDEAAGEIARAENEGRRLGLDEARDLLDQANDAYLAGNYEQASTLAHESKTKAEEAQKPFPLEVIGIALAAVTSLGFLALGLRKRRSAPELTEEERAIDIQKILTSHDLRDEEVEAVRFLADNNGQAFEAELFGTLDLPRTTTWRMVRRLEKMGIVDLKKFRKQNLISIRKRYEREK